MSTKWCIGSVYISETTSYKQNYDTVNNYVYEHKFMFTTKVATI